MSILGDICRPAVFFGCFGHHRQKDAALQDARTFAKTTKPAPPAGLQTSLNCKVEPLARSNSARGRTLQHQGEGSQSRASGCERVIGCRRQVRDLVFLVLVLQICRADGAGDEHRRQNHFAMDDWGERTRLACGFGRRARIIAGQISLGNGFRRDAENGNRDGRAPHFQIPHSLPRRSNSPRRNAVKTGAKTGAFRT